jgi:hypothetical protein
VREQVNGFKLDKSHTFSVNMFDEIERYARVPDEYEPPEEKHFQPSVRRPRGLIGRAEQCSPALACEVLASMIGSFDDGSRADQCPPALACGMPWSMLGPCDNNAATR